jgi:hypothetical protein
MNGDLDARTGNGWRLTPRLRNSEAASSRS